MDRAYDLAVPRRENDAAACEARHLARECGDRVWLCESSFGGRIEVGGWLDAGELRGFEQRVEDGGDLGPAA